jgi:hypothetical protein
MGNISFVDNLLKEEQNEELSNKLNEVKTDLLNKIEDFKNYYQLCQYTSYDNTQAALTILDNERYVSFYSHDKKIE